METSSIDNLTHLFNLEYFVRLLFAVIFGFCIGLE